MKKFILVFLLFSNCIYGQTSLNYFPWQSMLGVTVGLKNIAAVDYKVETNSFFNYMNMELGFRRTYMLTKSINQANYLDLLHKVRLNYGVGFAFNPANASSNTSIMNGYFIDLGLRWAYKQQKNVFYVILDLSPYVNEAFTNGNLRTRLGLGYEIGKK